MSDFSSGSQSPLEGTVLAQLQQRLLQLGSQIDAIQAQVGQVSDEIAQERSQLDILLRQLSNSAQADDPLQDRLVEVTEQLSAENDQLVFLGRKLTELATQDQLVRLATLVSTQQQVMDLTESVQALERAQQRSNELTESRTRQVNELLDTVQDVLNRRSELRERQFVVDQTQLDQVRKEARGEFVATFLPALDGIERVLEDGRALLARQRQDIVDAAQGTSAARGSERPHAANPNLVNRLRSRLGAEGEQGESGAPAGGANPTTAQAIHTWVRHLALVRDRFLALMFQEGIEPIAALHQTLDPQLHVAVQTEPREDVAPDTIVREVRRGYRAGERILRYAEVVVARPPAKPSA